MPICRMKNGLPLRAASLLTNSAVPTAPITVQDAMAGRVSFQIDLTIGALTNVTLTPRVSPDATNWYDVSSPGPLTLTASGSKAFAIDASGFKYARLDAIGTGTVTGSSLAVKGGYRLDV